MPTFIISISGVHHFLTVVRCQFTTCLYKVNVLFNTRQSRI